MDKPTGLRAKGSALWDTVVPAYELRADEFRVLKALAARSTRSRA